MRKRKLVYLDNEKEVIDSVVQLKNYFGSNSPFGVLNKHISSGGSIKDSDLFYNNIVVIAKASYSHGYDIIYNYCKKGLRSRFPFEVEKNLISASWEDYRGMRFIYKYAKYVVRNKLEKELEVGCSCFNYVQWLYEKNYEYSDILLNNSRLAFHFYSYNYFLPEQVHYSLLAKQLTGDYGAKNYFKKLKKDNKIIKNRLKILDGDTKIKDFLNTL